MFIADYKEAIMKKIKLILLFIAIFGLASTGTVWAGGGKNHYGRSNHYNKHHQNHFGGGRHFGGGYYGGRGYYDRDYYRSGYGGFGLNISYGGYYPPYYAYPPVVVAPQVPPVYIQRW